MRRASVVVVLLALAVPASAHAAHVRAVSAPASAPAGGRLAVRVSLAGRAQVALYLLRDGHRTRLGRRRLRDGRRRLLLAVPAGAAAGRYRVLACVGRRCRRSAGLVTVTRAPAGSSPTIAGCPILPAASAWNRDVSAAPLDPASDRLVAEQAAGHDVHLDFGDTQPEYGIPFSVVPADQPRLAILFGTDGADYGDESDHGPFPVPPDAPIEGATRADPDPAQGDRHVLVLQQGSCVLYELYNAVRVRDAAGRVTGFRVSSSARWDLRADTRRPAGWTSADAAGLPILPGLLRYDEAASGEIRHALRFTLPRARRAYLPPAGHCGPYADPRYPAYGSRWRLKASFDESPYHGPALAIVRALKRYGLMFADQGSAMFVTGVSDPRWTATIEEIDRRHPLPGDAFEVVAGGPLTTC
jgi:hypothetical protein